MTTLRVRLGAPVDAEHTVEWGLFDASGACVRTGADRRDAWPAADKVDVVLAASQLRIASLRLPPMPASRVAGAAGFALEDQLAGPAAAHQLTASPQGPDGRVRVIVVARALLAEIAASCGAATRIIAEPELAVPMPDWRWCVGDDAGGFVRCADGSAFPVEAPPPAGALPAELSVALGQARREGTVPPQIRVEGNVADDRLPLWQREAGIPLVRGGPWRWQDAPAAAFASAQNLLLEVPANPSAAPNRGVRRLFAPALALAGAALAIHIVAAIGEWASLRIDSWREAREWTSLATAAGVPADAAATAESARTALARRYADLRHAQGLPAPDDALPLLARAAPALTVLPAGSVKSATYADGHWTLDLARADAAVLRELDMRMRAARVPTLVAPTAGGARVRFGGP